MAGQSVVIRRFASRYIDIDAIVSMLVGPLFHRRFISRQTAPPRFVRQLVVSAPASLVITSAT